MVCFFLAVGVVLGILHCSVLVMVGFECCSSFSLVVVLVMMELDCGGSISLVVVLVMVEPDCGSSISLVMALLLVVGGLGHFVSSFASFSLSCNIRWSNDLTCRSIHRHIFLNHGQV